MVRPPLQLSKHQAASKEEFSFSLTPSVSDIVWRQGPPLPPPPSRVQSLEKGSNNDETCNESWTLRRLKQDMEEMRAENARMAHLVNVLRLSLRKQVRITQSTKMRAMDSERQLRMLRMNVNRVEVETPCKMGILLDPVLENPPVNLEDAVDFSRQRNDDGLMTMEGREWVGTINSHMGLKERLIEKESSFSREKNKSPDVGLTRHKSGVMVPSKVPAKEDECDRMNIQVKKIILDETTSQTQRSIEMGTVPSMVTKKETRICVKKSKDYEKKFEAAACKLEEQVTKEDGLPMWLRERLEEGKLGETLKDNGGEHGNSSDIDENSNRMVREKEGQRRRASDGMRVTVLPATKEGTRGDFGNKISNDLDVRRKMGMAQQSKQNVATFKSSYLNNMNEERLNVERKTSSPPPSLSENQEVSLREVTRLFANLQAIEEKLQGRLIEGKKTVNERTHNGRSNDMASRARSGTTTEEGASVFSKSSDDKENMAELRKTEGGKQSKQEVAEEQTNGHENEGKEGQVSRHALRKGRVLSYKEPSVMSKIRRHTGHSPGTIFPRASDGYI